MKVSMSPTFYPLFFVQYFCATKLQSQNVTIEKLRKALSYKKFSCKMLIKLTQGVNLINISQVAFSHESVMYRFSLLTVCFSVLLELTGQVNFSFPEKMSVLSGSTFNSSLTKP